MAVLGIDFGTSNSAVGVIRDGRPHLVELEAGQTTMPTAVFFDFDARKMVVGEQANAALLTGLEGRYMRALKSLLGTALMREPRMLLGERQDFIAITARFLAELKARAEAATGEVFDRVLSGRPVRFHSENAARNVQAEVDLRDAYLAAGFAEVRFMAEPEAAALANREVLAEGDLGLIVDIGGGTSDFTLFRHDNAAGGIDILASHGVRLGGTDFDRALSLAHVMPLLGKGCEIRHAFGSATHPAPNTIFNELATWQKIPFLYTHETRRAARELEKYAVEPAALGRLVAVLEEELGHDLAFAVEAGKIAANNPEATALPEIRLDIIARGLRVDLPGAMMAATLMAQAAAIGDAATETLMQVELPVEQVSHLIFVGGSSLMAVVKQSLVRQFPAAKLHRGAALTAIVDGLALGAEAAFA